MQLPRCAFMNIVSSERSLNMTLFDVHRTIECTTEICHFGAIASSLLGFWDNWVCTWWVCQPHAQPRTWEARVSMYLASLSNLSRM